MAFSSLLVLGSGFQFERRAPTCNVLDAFPYFKIGDVDIRVIDEKPQAQLKNQMKYMIEFSRFMNGKSPHLLQVRSSFNTVSYNRFKQKVLTQSKYYQSMKAYTP